MEMKRHGRATYESPVGLQTIRFDLSDTPSSDKSVSTNAGYIRGLLVNTTLTHAVTVKVDGTAMHVVPAGTPPGPYPLFDMGFDSSCALDPDNSLSAGDVTAVFYEYPPEN